MARLSQERPIFHSEADFQHALAWQIQRALPDCGVRLEYRPFADEAMYLDLWLFGAGVALELKYATRKLDHSEAGEAFSLKDQSAHDVRRYDFLRDIERLERVAQLDHVRGGMAILLTNDAAYWKQPAGPPDTIDADFRLHEGRRIGGELAWSEKAGEGTTKGREEPIQLGRSYELSWRNYSAVEKRRHQQFRYLLVQVSG